MKIMMFSQFYPPESIAGAFRAAAHARLWSDSGHDVSVFTTWPNYPTGRLFSGYRVQDLAEEDDQGVRVLRSRSIIQTNTSFLKRVIGGLSFLVYGVINCTTKRDLLNSKCDISLASCGPVFTGFLGLFFARFHKAMFVVEFRDIAYKQMVATGQRENDWKVALMKFLELSLCRSADHVVVLTPGFLEVLSADGIPREKMSIAPNGADTVECDHSWSGILRFGYFGTMGISQDVNRTLEYLSLLAERNNGGVRYLLIGDGAVWASIQDAIESGGYHFADLRHGMRQDELEAYYSAVDMTVVSLQKSESFFATIPSKIFQSFARGIPVCFIGPEGEAAQLVRQSGAGITLCGTSEEDVELLMKFSENPDLPEVLSDMSLKATSFIEENDYTRESIAGGMLRTFERLLGSHTTKNLGA